MSTVKLLTEHSPFERISIIDTDLLAVQEGIPAEFAVTKAVCLAESIEHLATLGVQDRIEPEVAYLMAFAASAIRGLLNSVERPLTVPVAELMERVKA